MLLVASTLLLISMTCVDGPLGAPDTVVLGDGETKQSIEEEVELQHNSVNIILYTITIMHDGT